MSDFILTCTGNIVPMLMHNARLANPLDDVAKLMKRITSKRVKTDEDYEELARLEFGGSLYLDEEHGPVIPGQNISRCLVDAARVTKNGKKIERGVFITSDTCRLEYDGPRTHETMWEDKNFVHYASVKVGTSRVVRTRPQFRNWSLTAQGTYDPAVINLDELREIADTAGRMIGLGDWRPRFGRFTTTLEKVKNG